MQVVQLDNICESWYFSLVQIWTYQEKVDSYMQLQEYYIQVISLTNVPLPEFLHRLQLRSQPLSGPSGSVARVLHSARGSEDSTGSPRGGSVALRGCVGSQQVDLAPGGLAAATRHKAQRPAGEDKRTRFFLAF